MAHTFLLLYVTHPNEATAHRIAEALLRARLVACANVMPISSAYWWEGAIARENEWVTLMKTRLALEEAVESAITAIHPYQVPCVMRLEVRANQAYWQWIEESTAQGNF